MKNMSKNVVLWIIIGLLLIVLFNLFQGTNTSKNSSKISFSDFLAATQSGNVSEVNINGNNVTGFFDDGRSFNTYAPNYPDLVDRLNEKGVEIFDISTGTKTFSEFFQLHLTNFLHKKMYNLQSMNYYQRNL